MAEGRAAVEARAALTAAMAALDSTEQLVQRGRGDGGVDDLERLLSEHGFGAAGLDVGLRELLTKYSERGEQIARLAVSKAHLEQAAAAAERRSASQTATAARAEVSKWKSESASDTAKSETSARKAQREAASAAKLREDKAAVEARLRASEDARRDSERRLAAAEKRFGREAERQPASPKSPSELPADAAAAFEAATGRSPRKGNAADAKALQVARMAAAQRARLEDELAALRDDVSQLRAAVSRGDDEPQGRRLFAGVEEAEAADVCAAPPPPRTAQERDVSLAEELRLAQESLRASQKLVERVTAERDGLLCRPTLHEWRDAQRAIAHLERRLAATTKTTTTMRRERELRKYLSTAELVGRDKLDFDLQLHALEDLPRSVATDVLREVCRDLELRDAEDVPPAVRKLATACEALPRLEAFARRVVALTFEAPRPIEACLDELKKWRAAVADAGDARKFRGRVADALRPLVPVDWKIDDDDEVARALAHVCSLAARARSDALAYRGADATLASTPDAVLTQILLHVKRLFAVKTVDGLVPCLEKVHANLHTLETFKRSVAHALVCGAETPAAALLDALDRRLERPDDGEESRDLQHEARDLQHEDE